MQYSFVRHAILKETIKIINNLLSLDTENNKITSSTLEIIETYESKSETKLKQKQKLTLSPTCYFLSLKDEQFHLDTLSPDNYIITDKAEGTEAVVSFIKNKNMKINQTYIIKQLKGKRPDEQFSAVIEMLASHIAESIDIPLHKVRIIAPGQKFIGKIDKYPATIHTIAFGSSVEKLMSKGNNKGGLVNDDIKSVANDIIDTDTDIHQKSVRTNDSEMGKLYGQLDKEEAGLTITIIRNMSQHFDLPVIAALDTFVNNDDRSAPNIFYDNQTDRFCGIDMAASFASASLGALACYHINNIILSDAKVVFKWNEIKALEAYYNTLKLLCEYFPPKVQTSLLSCYMKQAGFSEGSWLLDQDVKDKIYFHKMKIKENYQDCQKLLNLLLRLLHKVSVHHDELL